MNKLIEWNCDDDKPIISGWYVYTYCYDIQEGVLSKECYFDGVNWHHSGIFAGPFANKQEASDWCYEHVL